MTEFRIRSTRPRGSLAFVSAWIVFFGLTAWYLPDSPELREAIAACAPADHVVQTALVQGRSPRFAPLIVGAACLALVSLVAVVLGGRLWFRNHERMGELSRSYAAHSNEFERDVRIASTIDVYGRWDLFSEGPARTAISSLRPEDLREFVGAPQPYWPEITVAARARLATGAEANDLNGAIGDARNLARLAYSTETFSGATAGLAILMAETRLREKLNRLEAEPGLPIAISEQTLAAARRALLAYAAFFSPIAPDAVRKRLFASPDLRFGRCQGVAGGIVANLDLAYGHREGLPR